MPVPVTKHSLATDATLTLAGAFFALVCALLLLLQFIIARLVFSVMLAGTAIVMSVLFIYRRLKSQP